jgi:hypothetical protein
MHGDLEIGLKKKLEKELEWITWWNKTASNRGIDYKGVLVAKEEDKV